jgi:hypothetical protein
MTDFRSSQTIVGVFADWDPSLRIAQHYVEAALDTDPNLRVAQHYVEAALDDAPAIRVTQYHLEVLYSVTEAEEEGVHHVIRRRPSWWERGWRYDEDSWLPHMRQQSIEEPPDPPPVDEEDVGVEHWWLDMELGGFWRIEYGSADFDPQSILNFSPLETFDRSDVMLGGVDGYVRHLDRSVFEDDDIPFDTKVMIGPFLVGASSWIVGLVDALQGVLTPDSGPVTWELRVHREWEDAAKEATAVDATGTWDVAGVNDWRRPRSRGAAYSIVLTGGAVNQGWSIEEIVVHTSGRGKRRF